MLPNSSPCGKNTFAVWNTHLVPVEAAVLAGAICLIRLVPRSRERGPIEESVL